MPIYGGIGDLVQYGGFWFEYPTVYVASYCVTIHLLLLSNG